jgi:outer membrane receptor protein involved in Fe transport
MLDGVPLNDPFGNWVIWSQLAPDTIERVDIVRGSGAGAYGAGALTGTAQLYETTSADSAWAATAGAGEDGARRLSARAYPALGSGRLALSIAGEEQDGFTPVRTAQRGPVDIDAFYKSSSAAARWASDIGGADLALRLGAYEEQRGGGVEGVESASRGAIFSAALGQTDSQGEGWRASLWAHRSDFENSSASVNSTRSTSTAANDQYATPAIGYGANAAWRTRFGAAELEFGGDARFYDGETREHYFLSGGVLSRNRVSGGEENIAGLYAEASYHTGAWLFTGGLRLDHWSTQDAQRLETVIASGATLNDIHAPDRDGEIASWRLGLARALSDDVSVRAAAYSGFRPPSLNELHRPFRVGSDVTEANPSLDPERLLGAELGLNGKSDQWDWSATLFYNRLEDAIANVTIALPGDPAVALQGYDGALLATAPAGGVLRQRRNLDAINAIGFESDLSYQATHNLALRGALSATDARVDGGSLAPGLTNKRPAQAPIYSLTAGAEWRVTEAWRLRADWRWESGRWEDDQNRRRLAEGGQLNLQSAWSLNERIEVRLHADNLLDSEIETAESADGVESLAAPRQIWIELALR